jgi:hypothetical protein
LQLLPLSSVALLRPECLQAHSNNQSAANCLAEIRLDQEQRNKYVSNWVTNRLYSVSMKNGTVISSQLSISQTSAGILAPRVLFSSSARKMVLMKATASCSQMTPKVVQRITYMDNICNGQEPQIFLMLNSQKGNTRVHLSHCTIIQMIAPILLTTVILAALLY